MSSSPLVFVIVVNYNGTEYLASCLSSLEKQTYSNLRVVVVDNASTEKSEKFIRQQFPKATLIPSKENLGFTGGNNLAMKLALEQNADYLFLVNNDTDSPKDLIEKLVSACEKDPSVGIAAPAVFDLNNKNTVQELGVTTDRFAYPLPIKTPPKDDSCLFFVSGCSMMIKANLISHIGLFDEAYFMFVEDLDLCWRAQLSGYRPIVDYSAKIYHASGASLTGGIIKTSTYNTNVRRVFFREKNTIRTLIKNYGSTNLAIIVPFYVSLLLAESLLWLCLLKPATSKMILKALLWNLVVLPETLRQRAIVQRNRKVSDRQIVAKMVKGYNKLVVFGAVGVPRFSSSEK
jgi:GT2 family glycosyltransferase